MTQPTLLMARREFDLPPKWDGHSVEWHGWETPPRPFCAHSRYSPDSPCCVTCGYIGEQVQNRGTVRSEYVLQGISSSRRTRSFVRNLTAFRCQHCGHDQVLDSLDDYGRLWDLEDKDYTSAGSWA